MMSKTTRITICVLATLGIPIGVFWGAFQSISVCVVCGAEQHSILWQIPLTEVTYFRSTSTASTALSRTVTSDGLIPTHTHDWHFAAGSGNGTMCAIGDGRHLLGAIETSEVAAFVDAVARYRGTTEAHGLLRQLPTPDRSHVLLTVATLAPIPAGGFKTQTAFETWWNQTAAERAAILNP